MRSQLSQSSIACWQRQEYRDAVSSAVALKWQQADYRQRMLLLYSDVNYKKAAMERSRNLWLEDAYREAVTESCIESASTPAAVARSRLAATKQWQDSAFRDKMQRTLAEQPKVTSIQRILYSMLDDLKVKYFREYNDRPDDAQCVIGPYHFDCAVPRGDGLLLIECQGNYWHSTPQARQRDSAKASYITNNFPQHELKYIWEHEFYNYNKVIELLKYWLHAEHDVVDFQLNDVTVKLSRANEYRDLLTKYHYLPNAGRGGRAVGAYYNDLLIAVAVFSPPIRQNVGVKDALEISRLCVHPNYRKPNLISWFLARAVKFISCSALVAYSDTTFNHTGAVYKASGFTFIGETQPDYWYVAENGWVMHKKTLYNRAVNLQLTESEFSNQFGYKKVYGGKKLKFVKMLK